MDKRINELLRAVSLAVERLLHTQEVVGSNPIPRNEILPHAFNSRL